MNRITQFFKRKAIPVNIILGIPTYLKPTAQNLVLVNLKSINIKNSTNLMVCENVDERVQKLLTVSAQRF